MIVCYLFGTENCLELYLGSRLANEQGRTAPASATVCIGTDLQMSGNESAYLYFSPQVFAAY
ncbi:hypothetical protein UC8_08780 [Roseimaritima ulvae]|uniref:Uncharacterized protein n=1 Tax=Roseimaritima ulvae TaxID=980254 RepID=A0A5B9QLM1_9BACT|nr:hypothetical protein UC8_08780 [Roseimaritima ulvae]